MNAMTAAGGIKSVLRLSLAILLTGCQTSSLLIEPNIGYVPQQRHIRALPSGFPSLSYHEADTDWGREYTIGRSFAHELDLYRAITAYKRALILLPEDQGTRRLEITYHIILCYYLGEKYKEAVETFEDSELTTITAAFPPFGDLLVLLYDAYMKDCRFERAEAILQLIEKCSPETAADLRLYDAVVDGEVGEAYALAAARSDPCSVTSWLDRYESEAKSVRTAQALNAVLPGAGYAYVGQRSSALTSFVLNGLFIAAAYEFFHRDYIAAGLITLTFESGWYFGGINGAGLAAKEYNEHIYGNFGKELLIENRLFPILMFEFAF